MHFLFRCLKYLCSGMALMMLLHLYDVAYALPIVNMTTTTTKMSVPLNQTTTATYTVKNTSGMSLTRIAFFPLLLLESPEEPVVLA